MTDVSRRRFCMRMGAAVFSAGLGRRVQAQTPDESSWKQDGTWSADPLWRVLKTAHLTTDASGMVQARMSKEVLALSGKELSISGFILPIEAAVQSRHFILSRFSPECSFCPVGAPNEVIEVFSTKPMRAANYLVFLKGRFSVQNNIENGLFFRMDDTVVA